MSLLSLLSVLNGLLVHSDGVLVVDKLDGSAGLLLFWVIHRPTCISTPETYF